LGPAASRIQVPGNGGDLDTRKLAARQRENAAKKETRATKSAGPDTARKKSHVKYGWVHNFRFYQVNYVKHSEMVFFLLAISFWELANYNKWQTKNAKPLEMLVLYVACCIFPQT
jgi:hypothetical protein